MRPPRALGQTRAIRARASQLPVRRPWWHFAAPVGALAAVAAVLLLVFVRRPNEPQPGDDDVQFKGGGISLVVLIATPDGPRHAANGETVGAGTRIRFQVSGVTGGYVAVIGIDGANVATVYAPYGASAPIEVTGSLATGGVLPGAIELDATPGDEHVFAVYSPRSFSFDAVIAALRAGASLPPGITASEVVLHKSAQ